MAQSILGTVKGVYIDTETGGLDPKIHGTTEVAAVSFEIDLPIPGQRDLAVRMGARYHSFVKPSPWLAYCPGALALQSYLGRETTLEFLAAHGREELTVIQELNDFLECHIYPDAKLFNGQIWAQNADFDHGFLSAMHGRVVPNQALAPAKLFGRRGDWSCSRKLFSKLCGMMYKHSCQYGAISQKDIMKFYGIDSPQQHSALQDCFDGIKCLGYMFADEANYYAQLYGLAKVPE